MPDTTIKVSADTRNRLALLATEQGTTVKDLVADLAAQRPTVAERARRGREAASHIRAHLVADFTDDDAREGARLWAQLSSGTLTEL